MTAGTRRLIGRTRRVGGRVALATALAAVASVVELIPFYLLYRAVVSLGNGVDGGELVRLGLAIGLAGAAQVVLWAAAMYVSHVAAYEHLHDLRLRLLDRLTRLPLGDVLGRRSSDLQRVVVDDVGKIELFVAHALPELVASIVAWVVVTVWLLSVDPRMTLATIAVVAVAFAILMGGTRRSRAYLARTTVAALDLGRGLVDLVDGLLTLAVFDRSGRTPPSLDRAIGEVADSNAEWLGRFAPYGTAYNVLIAAPALLVVPVGGALVLADRASADDFLLFLIIGLGYGAPIVRLRRIWFQLNTITFASGVIDQVLATEAQPEPEESTPVDGASIEFDQVSFSYGDTPTITDVSFTVAPGTLTALVGPSGSGKSTIARLIGRFWDVDDGEVRVGGVDVRDRRLDDLLGDATFVFQDTFLFRDTIAANLRVARPDATDDELVDAAVVANADEFVRTLPDGYATPIGPGGVRLSGGQRQRLAIARAVLHDAPIVVLDEATAFVDPDSEALVRRSLRAMTEHRTVVVIAHRLTSVVDADQILVVDGGRVTQRGRHEDLVSAPGTYRTLWDDWHSIDRLAP